MFGLAQATYGNLAALSAPNLFPTVVTSNTSTNVAGTSHVVSLPSGLTSGDLLIFAIATEGSAGVSTPSGWTIPTNGNNSSGGTGADELTYVFYKVSNGSEGSSVTVTTSGSVRSAHFSLRIANYSGTPEVAATTTLTTTSADPPNLTPTGGAGNYLWIALTGYVDATGLTVSSFPSGYTDNNLQILNNTGTRRHGVGVATKILNATSENPGAFTISGTTVVVTPMTVSVKGP